MKPNWSTKIGFKFIHVLVTHQDKHCIGSVKFASTLSEIKFKNSGGDLGNQEPHFQCRSCWHSKNHLFENRVFSYPQIKFPITLFLSLSLSLTHTHSNSTLTDNSLSLSFPYSLLFLLASSFCKICTCTFDEFRSVAWVNLFSGKWTGRESACVQMR